MAILEILGLCAAGWFACGGLAIWMDMMESKDPRISRSLLLGPIGLVIGCFFPRLRRKE